MRVTEHAFLRYIERVMGLDMEKIQQEILSPAVRAALKGRAASVSVGKFTYVLNAGSVVTVKPRRATWRRGGQSR